MSNGAHEASITPRAGGASSTDPRVVSRATETHDIPGRAPGREAPWRPATRRLASRAVAGLAALTLLASGGLVAGGPAIAADQVIARDGFGRTSPGTLGRGYEVSGKARWSVAGSAGVSRLSSPGVGQATVRSARATTTDLRVVARIADPRGAVASP